MAVGSYIRRMFGPYERHISEAYRAIFFDIDSFVRKIREWRPTASAILEVGCGEGAVTERLRAAYPDAKITAIDIIPGPGRLYNGEMNGVQFCQSDVQTVAADEPGQYDLVVLCDVLHHVPLDLRQSLLDAIRTTLAPHGVLIFKKWERSRTPIHWLCFASDRWLTGDRVAFMTRAEMRRQLMLSFGEAALDAEMTLAPWRNNVATVVQI